MMSAVMPISVHFAIGKSKRFFPILKTDSKHNNLAMGKDFQIHIEIEGGDKVPNSKFGLWTSLVVFIGLIKTYFVF